MIQIEKFLTVGQEVYIAYNDKLVKKQVVSLTANKGGIDGVLKWHRNEPDQRGTDFHFNEGKITGTYEYAYNRTESFVGFLTLEEAAAHARENVLKINQQMRRDVQKAMDKLKKFREKHHELLWTDENNRWIECFEREYQW